MHILKRTIFGIHHNITYHVVRVTKRVKRMFSITEHARYHKHDYILNSKSVMAI